MVTITPVIVASSGDALEVMQNRWELGVMSTCVKEGGWPN